MQLRDNDRRFGTATRAMHWAGVAVVFAAIALIEVKDWFPKGSALREGLKSAHFQLGAIALVLTLARMLWRLRQTLPAIHPEPPAWQDLAGRALHVLFYVLLVALPLSGIATLQARGDEVVLLGMVMPAPLAADPVRREALKEVHEFLGNAMMLLIGLHVAAALYHHWVRRDDTLRRMLPPA
ncbi:MAG TPA: cytochrome b [Burkholderiaceae bacterium]|nr:cytochrome b [Burkholderiaceae bacterium]